MNASRWRRALTACASSALLAALALPAGALAAAPVCQAPSNPEVVYGGQTSTVYFSYGVCSDADQDPLVFEITSQPAQGSLSSVANGYQKSVHFTAPDVNDPTDVTFGLRAHDGTGASSNEISFPVTIVPAGSSAPYCQAFGGSFTVTQTIYNNQPRDVGISCVRGSVPVAASLHSGPAHGTLGEPEFDGGRIFRPDPSFAGEEAISFQVAGESAPRTIRFDVKHPQAPDCSTNTSVGYGSIYNDGPQNVYFNCWNRGGLNDLKFEILSGPSTGSFSGLDGHAPMFTAPAGFTGDVTFRYRAIDELGASEVRDGVLNIVNRPSASAPECYGQSGQTRNTRPLTIELWCYGVGAMVTEPVDGPQHGTLSARDPNADGLFVYTPAPGHTGVDSFTFKATNGAGASNVARMVIWVLPASQGAANANSPVSCGEWVYRNWIDVNATDAEIWVDCWDTDNDALSREAIAPAAVNGTVGAFDGSVVRFTPNRNFAGLDQFGSRIGDGATSDSLITRVWTRGTVSPASHNTTPTTTPTTPIDTAKPVAAPPKGRVLGSFGPISFINPAAGGTLGVNSPGVDLGNGRGSFGTAYNGGATDATVTATGSLKLDRRGRASASAKKKKAKTLRLAQVRHLLTPGQSRALSFKLGSKARKAIGSRKSVKVSVTVVVAPKGGKVVKSVKTLTLKVQAKKKSKKKSKR